MFAPSKIVNSIEPLDTPQPKQSSIYLLHGVLASILLTVAYFSIVTIAESFNHAVTAFVSIAYLMVPLIASFGIQIALFSFTRRQSKLNHQRSTNAAASGGMSTASMVACCAHHLTDVAALIGLTSVAVFLTTYQTGFILIGLLSNIVGILTSLIYLQKNKFYSSQGFFSKAMRVNWGKARKLAVTFGIVIIVSAFAWIAFANPPVVSTPIGNPMSDATPTVTPYDMSSDMLTPAPSVSSVNSSESRTISQNGLTIIATPLSFTFGSNVQIDLALDTHSGDLNFDLTKVSTLQDSNGKNYTVTGWAGDSPGGHHVSGTLTFPPLDGNPSSITLVLNNVYEAGWNFTWTLTS